MISKTASVMHGVRTSLIACVVCGAMPWDAAQGAERPVTITLPSHVEVKPGSVRVGDIAAIDGPVGSDTQHLSALVLGQMNVNDTGRHVSREELSQRLERHTGLDGQAIRWRGASVVHIEVAAQVVTASQIEQCGRALLHAWLAAQFQDVHLDRVSRGADVRVAAGRLDLQARPVDLATPPTARMTAWIDVLVDGQVVRSVPVTFAVKAFQPVWVARRDLRPGQALLDDDVLQLTVIDVAQHGLRPWSVDLARMRLRKPLLAGQPLTPAHVEPRSVVARGATVEICAADGELEINGQGEALQDGQTGDWIKVRLPRATGPVLARVLGPGLVGAPQ